MRFANNKAAKKFTKKYGKKAAAGGLPFKNIPKKASPGIGGMAPRGPTPKELIDIKPMPPGFGGTRPPGPRQPGVTPRPMPRPKLNPNPNPKSKSTQDPGRILKSIADSRMQSLAGSSAGPRPPSTSKPYSTPPQIDYGFGNQAPPGSPAAQNPLRSSLGGMKKGGAIKSSASKRADGVAKKGKTRGTMV